jgi:mannose-6-phosphate isomerase-like protein (cupin superfamily)
MMEAFRKLAEVVAFSDEKMRKNRVFETERMSCDVYCFEPGQAQAVHAHDGSDKVYFVLEGTGTFRVGGSERELRKNEFAIAESGTGHGVENRGGGRLTVLVFVAPRPSH